MIQRLRGWSLHWEWDPQEHQQENRRSRHWGLVRSVGCYRHTKGNKDNRRKSWNSTTKFWMTWYCYVWGAMSLEASSVLLMAWLPDERLRRQQLRQLLRLQRRLLWQPRGQRLRYSLQPQPLQENQPDLSNISPKYPCPWHCLLHHGRFSKLSLGYQSLVD